jgi:predicted TPR repeat methyltransferase
LHRLPSTHAQPEARSMTAHHLSSGDLIADRRAGYARMLAEGGEFAAAADLMEQTLELVPHWAAGWFLLGEYHEKTAGQDLAVDAYRRTLELNSDDIFGAGLKLSILGERDQPAQPPVAYVEQLFDDYADHFEEALVEKLDYQVPACLAELITREGSRTYATAIDLGCGTGLMGVELRPFAAKLEGYDLSANMLAKADEKNIYDHLAQADLSLRPDKSPLFAEGFPEKRADLVVAADVLMYLGDLENLFLIARQLLASRGHFAFSVELSSERDGFHLQPSLRYAHTTTYIETLMPALGFRILASQTLVIRTDGGAPVEGFLFLSQYAGNA